MNRSGVFSNVLNVAALSSLCCHLCVMIPGAVPFPIKVVSFITSTSTVEGSVITVGCAPSSRKSGTPLLSLSSGVEYPSKALVTTPFTLTNAGAGPRSLSPSSSVNPASITSGQSSPSESRSKQLTIPSPSVSIKHPSVSSKIPSLSESKST